jgi:hypothetical protein
MRLNTKGMPLGIAAMFSALGVLSTAVARPPQAWTAPRYAVYGNPRSGWVGVEAHSRALERIALPKQYAPEEVALAPDGRLIFTALDSNAGNRLLFTWDSRTPEISPKSIGEGRGFHSNPSVTGDGWVYFAHNPNAFGPPGRHEVQAYAEIYRARLDGTGLEALTDNPGCHWGPAASAGGLVAYVHMTCVRGMWVEYMRGAHSPPEVTSGRDELIIGVDAAPDGQSVLFTVRASPTNVVRERSLTSSDTHELLRYPDVGSGRAMYGADRSHVFYQSAEAIWEWSRGGTRKLGDLKGGQL